MRLLFFIFFLTTLSSVADPCGMVPPISLDGEPATIKRVGEQNTYVFFKDGMETMVIHPGFTGSVDEFGMLIPFPTPPALRKVSDNTFPQMKQAVDPPIVTYYLYNNRFDDMTVGHAGLLLESASMAKDRDEVVVLKEEAVGMYEIAVLEAGSASALKRWMDNHGYRFPDGMEKACGDYVNDKWCFVAVKTRVGSKAGVDPKPGMRSTTPDKPKDAVFTGAVQAMGFRFRSKELVIPMRLSTFNEGDLKNTVYVLAEEPLRVSNLPVEFVRRQITGTKLLNNLTALLPYQIEGGDKDDMSPNDWKSLEGQRDPVPHNGVAAELFASDLLADEVGRLSHGYEEREKALLDIGERLGLRGGQLDGLHAKELETDRHKMKAQALESLSAMTLTVIEGDFPRETLANENLQFQPYRLANIEGLTMKEQRNETGAVAPTTSTTFLPIQGGLAMKTMLYGLILAMFAWFAGKRAAAATAVATLALLMVFAPASQAQEYSRDTVNLINRLDDPEQTRAALKELEAKGKQIQPYLLARYQNEEASVTERGYCLALSVKNPNKNVTKSVRDVYSKTSSSLVKLWSQAALVDLTTTPEELLALFDAETEKRVDPDQQFGVMPIGVELQRPIALKLKDWDAQLTLEDRLMFLGLAQNAGQASNVSPNISAVITPSLKSVDPRELVDLMFTSRNQEVRRISAGLLAGFTEDKRKVVFASVMEKLQVSGQAKEVPWVGGALFLPQFSNMNKSEATELITGLTRWSVWTDLHKTPAEQVTPIENNLRSYNLWEAAEGGSLDWRNASGGQAWLRVFGSLKGAAAASALLKEQNVPKDSDYWAVVKKLK